MKRILAVLAILLIVIAVPVLARIPPKDSLASDDHPSRSDGHEHDDHDDNNSLNDQQTGDHEEEIFKFETLLGSTPNTPVRTVPSGGLPWTVARGEAELQSDGKLEVKVEGLLLINTGSSTLDGTTGPVTGILASLTCEGSNVVASTHVASLSTGGNGELEETIALPNSCLGPIVLIRVGSTVSNPGPLTGPWIAATGF